ncbi:MAG: phosphomannomutase/phosphoglucomutase [Gammaproteobacteria bacterium]|nr:phosphomannomutase/phosphoglucomutase [Gammaproteobacteria bacterium]|tara:strand:- start:2009 stop:3484 length:1476 start_codon:yes stop_codon:yes gene_type:complete
MPDSAAPDASPRQGQAPQPHSVISATMFRAYDIRGIAGEDLTDDSIYLIGLAIGSYAIEFANPMLYFGADARLSSPALAASLKRGLLDAGCDIIDLGIVPTPLVYFATHTGACSSGVMLTASHNPANYNGIKIVRSRACLTAEQIQGIRERTLAIEAGQYQGFTGRQGSLTTHDMNGDYIARVCADVKLDRRLRVVVDCGNAVPGVLAPALFSGLGCEVMPMFCDLDGHFPNHHPDPTVASNLDSLISEVRTRQADLGVALDGDGDRVILVTDKGRIIDTDRLLMLLVQHILPHYDHPNVVFDVKCSNLLAGEIARHGGLPVMSRSGHSFMKQMMHETDAVVGGEFSAHVFIKDRWFGYDDGFYVAARFLEILAAGTLTADAMLQSLPQSVVTPELRIDVDESRKFELMRRISQLASFPQARISLLDGVRADFADGWGLIRASNTTPALLLRFEAGNPQSLHAIEDLFRRLLKQVDPQLDFSIPRQSLYTS